MTIKKAFADFMVAQGLGVFGENIFIGSAPLDAPAQCWWIISGGGANKSKNKTGEKQKNYTLNVFYRSLNAETVDQTLQTFEELINRDDCVVIGNYDIIETEATSFPSDQDIDNEERTVGLLEITLTVYSN